MTRNDSRQHIAAGYSPQNFLRLQQKLIGKVIPAIWKSDLILRRTRHPILQCPRPSKTHPESSSSSSAEQAISLEFLVIDNATYILMDLEDSL
jgi:hypothetical protein